MATEADLLLALDILSDGGCVVAEALRAEACVAQKAARAWIYGSGVQGVGIGPKIVDGKECEELALKVYVDRKKPRARAKHLIPPHITIPGVGTQIATDVEDIGVVRHETNTGRVRPAIPGYSVCHIAGTAGTFGCLVRKRGNKKSLYVLSNSHVLADSGLGAMGDEILQPGSSDGGAAPQDVIAQLAEWVPFEFSAVGFPNRVDAAIAKVKSAKSVTSTIRMIGDPNGASRTVRRGMQVQKTGRTTDYTIGLIRDVNFRTALSFPMPGGGQGRVGFRDQVLCTRYSEAGDSGSAVLNKKREVVGLHFAGSPSSSIFNRIGYVIDALQVDVVRVRI